MAENVDKKDGDKTPTLSFGALAAGGENSSGFNFGAAGTGFGAPGSAPLFGGAPVKFGESPKKEDDKTEGDDANPEAQESTAEFTPVVQLDEVEVKTHEEDEEVTFKLRAKLFRFTETLLNKGSGKKEWIERGVGEVKLLKHRESSMIRLLMRQEKTMKIICNHVVDPRIELAPNAGSDRSWVWTAWDFSSMTELEDSIFALRFGNAEGAKQFKEAFDGAQAEMTKLKAGEDGAADPAADEAADALAGLKAGEGDKEPA
eukprot:CAMPEP_0119260514 /NCGR_PEP_ID=MMETSP1329-20130426/861_1 /TAXON_ID=114041 /ORGANISM="Genus nov. species nov., Strain RCC1024" /LENGTH=258 /DNA_ID=CAMNT_0007259937 /DNA_START=50 /DNA_END=823 /DNA_ORIENTATION=+